MDASMKSQLDFTHSSPTIELGDYHEKISRKISSIDRTLVGCEKKSSSLLYDRGLLVDTQNLIDACLRGDDVPVWAVLENIEHLLN